jgi:hypothetical protein
MYEHKCDIIIIYSIIINFMIFTILFKFCMRFQEIKTYKY